MDEKIQWLKEMAARFRRFATENPASAASFAVLLLVVLPLVCSKFQEVHFVSKDVGYQYRGPRGWKVTVSSDKKTADFLKPKKFAAADASIRTEIDMGNPYGATLVDFMYAALIPQVRNEYELKQKKLMQFIQPPVGEYRDEVEWAKCSFFVDADSIYEIVMTTSNDYVITFQFESHGYGKEQDQAQFHRMMDSVRFFKVSHTNYFEEAVKPKPQSGPPPRRRGTM